jgi:hypothetical protein
MGLEADVFEDGKKKIKAAFKFNTRQARAVQQVVEARQRQLEKKEHADHSRVLMRFTRSDIGDVNVGKPSGERIVIEDISDKPLAYKIFNRFAPEVLPCPATGPPGGELVSPSDFSTVMGNHLLAVAPLGRHPSVASAFIKQD